jgi:hypothetical protein
MKATASLCRFATQPVDRVALPQGGGRIGGQAFRRAAASTTTRRTDRHWTVAHAGIAHPVPPILAAAQPHPLRSTKRAQRSGDRSAATWPMLCIASPAASPLRRTCGHRAAPGPRLARVCPPGTRVSAPLQVRVRRGRLRQVRAAWDRRRRYTAGQAARDAAVVPRALPDGISSARSGSFRHS